MNRRLWIVMLAIFGGLFISETVAFAQTANPRPLPSRDIRGPVPEVIGQLGQSENNALVGRTIEKSADLPHLGELVGKTVCITVHKDEGIPTAQGFQTCSTVRQTVRRPGDGPLLEMGEDMFYPPFLGAKVSSITYDVKLGWVAEVMEPKKFDYDTMRIEYKYRSVPLDELRLFQ